MVLVLVAGTSLGGCGWPRRPVREAELLAWNEATFARKPAPTYSVRLAPGTSAPAETIIGTPRTYRIREGDTLFDVARYHDLGYNEITEANPGVDAWVPKVGTAIVLPTEWVLPCCTYEGLVLNIPEMRLFFYQRAAGDPRRILVRTYPVGLGREDWRTPRGRFRVRGKTVNPQWNIPESIRQEHIRERGDARTSIRGGDPDNPLGKYRIELTIPSYTIHGTNVPWGTGMTVSHGCARLYPEDIERLFPLVPVGLPVEFTYQPTKVGRRGDEVFVEVHPDVYRYHRSLVGEALATVKRRGLDGRVDRRLLRTAVTESRGLPYRVGGGAERLRVAGGSPPPS